MSVRVCTAEYIFAVEIRTAGNSASRHNCPFAYLELA